MFLLINVGQAMMSYLEVLVIFAEAFDSDNVIISAVSSPQLQMALFRKS